MKSCKAASTDLITLADEVGISLSLHNAELLVRHLSLVLAKNAVMNLTRITDINEALIKHILDSLLYWRAVKDLPLPSVARFLDIGTGAGYPGIPFCIASGFGGMLIDSIAKKISAVVEFVDELVLANQLSCLVMRAESLALTEPHSFSIVVSRAVSKPQVLLEYASPLLCSGGYLVLSQGDASTIDSNDCKQAAYICGFDLVSRETIDLPQDFGRREIVVFQACHEASIKLPRKPGIANKRPLPNI